MKFNKLTLLIISVCCLSMSGIKCKKENSPTTEKKELPAVTQTGSNTFGFLMNGEVWLPKANLLKERLDLTYDPSYKDGSFGINANRNLSTEDHMELSIGLTGVNKPGKYTREIHN